MSLRLRKKMYSNFAKNVGSIHLMLCRSTVIKKNYHLEILEMDLRFRKVAPSKWNFEKKIFWVYLYLLKNVKPVFLSHSVLLQFIKNANNYSVSKWSKEKIKDWLNKKLITKFEQSRPSSLDWTDFPKIWVDRFNRIREFISILIHLIKN